MNCTRCDGCRGFRHHWFEMVDQRSRPILQCIHCKEIVHLWAYNETAHIKTEWNTEIFFFHCAGCDYESVIDMRNDIPAPGLECPGDCGAAYALRVHPATGKAYLEILQVPMIAPPPQLVQIEGTGR